MRKKTKTRSQIRESQIVGRRSQVRLTARTRHDNGDIVNSQHRHEADAQTHHEPHRPMGVLRDQRDHGEDHLGFLGQKMKSIIPDNPSRFPNHSGLTNVKINIYHIYIYHRSKNVTPPKKKHKHKLSKWRSPKQRRGKSSGQTELPILWGNWCR